MSAARLPYVDERAIEVAVPRDQEWVALRRYVAESLLTTGGGPLRPLLGTDPHAGFEIAAATPARRLELVGRHRFARYMLAFDLTDAAAGSMRVCSRTSARTSPACAAASTARWASAPGSTSWAPVACCARSGASARDP